MNDFSAITATIRENMSKLTQIEHQFQADLRHYDEGKEQQATNSEAEQIIQSIN